MSPKSKKILLKACAINRAGRLAGVELANLVMKDPGRYPELVTLAKETLSPTIEEVA